MLHDNARTNSGSLTPIRILHLENDAALAHLLKKHLERFSYKVDTVADSARCFEALKGRRYHVIVVGYRPATLDGLEVLRRLAESDQAPPAVMVTGDGSERVAVAALKLGAVDYLVVDDQQTYLELLPGVVGQALERPRRGPGLRQLERYRDLVDLSPYGISLYREGRFEYINPAGLKILAALGSDELLGREILDFVHPHYHQVFLERLRLLEERDIEVPWMEEKFLRLDGVPVDVEVTAHPFGQEGSRAFQIIFRDISERKAAEQRLERMAHYDELTALPSRSFFYDRLDQLILQGKRDGARFALLFIDLDRFSEANEEFGHYYGDLILKEVAVRLKSCLRETDTVARLDGGEFVVILSKIADREDAARVAERISSALIEPFDLQGQVCFLGASIGVSLFPEDGETKEQQLLKAGTAMYCSRQIGRNGCHFFSPDPAHGDPSRRLTRSGAVPGTEAVVSADSLLVC